jgi:hypothetical protein
MMNKSRLFLVLLVFAASCAEPERSPEVEAFPMLTGPYLGQTPPGHEPQLFAPGIVNTGLYTRDVAMTPDGSEIYFGVNVGNYELTAIMVTRLVDGRWTQPEVTPFSADPCWSDIEPAIAPDGKTLYFASNRPEDRKGEAEEYHSIWAMDRTGDSWGKPYRLPDIINDGSANFYPSVTEDGTLYFTRDLPNGENAIFRSKRKDHEYAAPERLPEQVNATRTQFNAFVAPDESYLIVPIYGMEDSIGSTDYYIVFRKPDDTWSDPINLGGAINTDGGLEYAPYVSPDGKYFFFMSSRSNAVELAGTKLTARNLHQLHNTPGSGLPSIWWVDAAFIDALRP